MTLRPEAGIDATTLDVAANPRGPEFRELESAQLPRAPRDVEAGVVSRGARNA